MIEKFILGKIVLPKKTELIIRPMVKANLYSEKYVKSLEKILEAILDDGKADPSLSGERLWPIRADNYRKARKLLDENK